MATPTIPNPEDTIKERPHVCAALHGRSMEEEARDILRKAVGGVTGPGLWERSRMLFARENGVELDLPSRREDRAPPSID